ncbi:MAG: RpiB/LacA/LacB family sugar-phosphate isomerase [Chloroflexi bacterium]|nr:RpiB/LacA/LacB family sugar-phosphate isomerase [Chloroflexota bacterium]
MRLAVGSDERTGLTETVVRHLRECGHEVTLHGALAQPRADWPDVGREVAERVADGRADRAVLFCWTGTGVCIAANKVRGIRAALCQDAETARGARTWNDANVLCLSLRSTSEPIAREIVDAWLETPFDPNEAEIIARVE